MIKGCPYWASYYKIEKKVCMYVHVYAGSSKSLNSLGQVMIIWSFDSKGHCTYLFTFFPVQPMGVCVCVRVHALQLYVWGLSEFFSKFLRGQGIFFNWACLR